MGADGAGRGVVGDADPVLAVERLWDRDRFDEATVWTLPTHLSRWLGIDLAASTSSASPGAQSGT